MFTVVCVENKNMLPKTNCLYYKDVNKKLILSHKSFSVYLFDSDLNINNFILDSRDKESIFNIRENNRIVYDAYKALISASTMSDKIVGLYDKNVYIICEDKRNNNDLLLSILLNATYIKNNKKRIEFVYDSCCDYLDKFYYESNICDFNCGKCVSLRKEPKYKNNSCCSSSCMFLDKKGCTTHNLACKLYYCDYLEKRGVVFNADLLLPLKLFYNHAQRRLCDYNFFISREHFLKKLHLAKIWGIFIV